MFAVTVHILRKINFGNGLLIYRICQRYKITKEYLRKCPVQSSITEVLTKMLMVSDIQMDLQTYGQSEL